MRGPAHHARMLLAGLSLLALGCTCGGLAPVLGHATPTAAAEAAHIVLPPPFDYPEAVGSAMGDPNAPVVIVEYGDFQCPFCRRFHDQTLPRLVDEYVRPGLVYFVYRHFPVVDRDEADQESHAAAAAAVCAARQDRFWPYHDVLFANQTAENSGDFNETRLRAMAEQLGLDLAAFDMCYASAESKAAVEADGRQAALDGIHATPSFLINGKLLVGAQPIDAFRTAIDAALGSNAPQADYLHTLAKSSSGGGRGSAAPGSDRSSQIQASRSPSWIRRSRAPCTA
ncbi:MAG TPA: thioredoxin domain-containing protein [Anaerolineales bacterium]|nr:thioredoxin domain-containing protein [Anaerolineales bacterium]